MAHNRLGIALKISGILAAVVVATAFFFAIIGVFGLSIAVVALALAILIALTINSRESRGEDHL